MSAVLRPVTTQSLPASRKIYQLGRLHPCVRVPMRQVSLQPAAQEAPLNIYDASGPYTDPEVRIDIARGLPRLREGWVAARADTETYVGRTILPVDNGLERTEAGAGVEPFPLRHAPRRARAGAVTQLAYARAGIITPEMEFIAIRENLGRESAAHPSAQRTLMGRRHPRDRDPRVRARRGRGGARHHSGQYQSSRERADDHRA